MHTKMRINICTYQERIFNKFKFANRIHGAIDAEFQISLRQ